MKNFKRDSFQSRTPSTVHPSIEVIVGEAFIDECEALIERASAAREAHGVDADLLVVAGVVSFIQLMTSSEFRANSVPEQLEQLDALERSRLRAAIVTIDEWAQFGVGEILGA